MQPGTPVDICGPYDGGRWVWLSGYKVMTAAAKPKYKKLTHKSYYNPRINVVESVIVVCGDRGLCFPVCVSNVRRSSFKYRDCFEFPRIGKGEVVKGYVVATEEDRRDLQELDGVREEEEF